jgi:hypothetical protein
MEVLDCSESLVSIYKSTPFQILEDFVFIPLTF